jgi:hypothetical protein
MNTPQVGAPSSGDRTRLVVKNDSGVSIPRGTPVSMGLDGTEDGLAIKLPSGLTTDLATTFFMGITTDTIGIGAYGEVVSFGIHKNAILLRATRASDTSNWAGSTSMAKGQLLSLDTVNNCFSTAAGSAAFASTDATTFYGNRLAFAFLASDVASFNSTLSTATTNGTALTVLARVFVKAL